MDPLGGGLPPPPLTPRGASSQSWLPEVPASGSTGAEGARRSTGVKGAERKILSLAASRHIIALHFGPPEIRDYLWLWWLRHLPMLEGRSILHYMGGHVIWVTPPKKKTHVAVLVFAVAVGRGVRRVAVLPL